MEIKAYNSPLSNAGSNPLANNSKSDSRKANEYPSSSEADANSKKASLLHPSNNESQLLIQKRDELLNSWNQMIGDLYKTNPKMHMLKLRDGPIDDEQREQDYIACLNLRNEALNEFFAQQKKNGNITKVLGDGIDGVVVLVNAGDKQVALKFYYPDSEINMATADEKVLELTSQQNHHYTNVQRFACDQQGNYLGIKGELLATEFIDGLTEYSGYLNRLIQLGKGQIEATDIKDEVKNYINNGTTDDSILGFMATYMEAAQEGRYLFDFHPGNRIYKDGKLSFIDMKEYDLSSRVPSSQNQSFIYCRIFLDLVSMG